MQLFLLPKPKAPGVEHKETGNLMFNSKERVHPLQLLVAFALKTNEFDHPTGCGVWGEIGSPEVQDCDEHSGPPDSNQFYVGPIKRPISGRQADGPQYVEHMRTA